MAELMQKDVRKTKMIWSFNARMLDQEVAHAVKKAKMDVVRLVFEPGYQAELANFVAEIRSDTKNAVPLMLDVASYYRASICCPTKDRECSYGDILRFTQEGGGGDVEIDGEKPDQLFKIGASVFLGFGNVILTVKDVNSKEASLEVHQGGTLFPGMDIQVPDTRKDLELAQMESHGLDRLIEAGLEFLVIQGNINTDELLTFRKKLKTKWGKLCPWLIAKIDNDKAVQNVDSLLNCVEGILISRREMALQMNPATVPMVTKEIIQLCNDRAKVVVTASEMLASMRQNVTPTRAEVSDIANAVIDGTDAVVLSEEVSMGKYGLKALDVMDLSIRDIEFGERVGQPNWRKQKPQVADSMDAIAYNAYRTGERVKARAIVCVTHEGNTALRLGSYRAPVPIIAVTFSEEVKRRLSLVRGVQVLCLDIDPAIDDVLPAVNDRLLRDSWLKSGDRIIFVSITVSSVGREASNLFTVQTLA